MKLEDVYSKTENDVEKRFYTPNSETERHLPIGKNIKVIGLIIKDELGGKIMTEFVGPTPKTYFC